MSANKKLAAEVDRTLRKIDEGCENFDDTYEKVYQAEAQNLREKYEAELKKEIKKLQRLRDQVKSWVSGNEVRDKEPLRDARRKIETKMEAFKVLEREAKTKTFSKAGLAREEQLDPEDQARMEAREWCSEKVDFIKVQQEELDAELERLSAGRGKKKNAENISIVDSRIAQHNTHINQLELIMRLLDNAELEADKVEEIKEDIDFYAELCKDTGYNEEVIDMTDVYESLDLESFTAHTATEERKEEKGGSAASKRRERKAAAAAAANQADSLITGIGRARDRKTDKKNKAGAAASSGIPAIGRGAKKQSGKPAATAAKAAASTPVPPPAASDGTQPEPPEVKDAPAESAPTPAGLPSQSNPMASSAAKVAMAPQIPRTADNVEPQVVQTPASTMVQRPPVEKKSDVPVVTPVSPVRPTTNANLRPPVRSPAQPSPGQPSMPLKMNQGVPPQAPVGAQQLLMSSPPRQASVSRQSSGGSSVGSAPANAEATTGTAAPRARRREKMDFALLTLSYKFMPTANDSDYVVPFTPRHAAHMPREFQFPTLTHLSIQNPAVFEKMSIDTLFFIFYHQQGTYAQHLAAQELKRKKWWFHKKYSTWFLQQDTKVVTAEFEQGTYIYFDYRSSWDQRSKREAGWCQRIKEDFPFELAYRETG